MAIPIESFRERTSRLGQLLPQEGTIFAPSPLQFDAMQVDTPRHSESSNETIYSMADFETVSPIGEENRRALIEAMTMNREEGRSLWLSSTNLRYITENATTHRALDRVYSGPLREVEDHEYGYLLADLMLGNLHNAMGSRNRKRHVTQTIQSFAEEYRKTNGRQLDILSIAAGSSSAVLEASAALQRQGVADVHIRLTDYSRDALRDGQHAADRLDLSDRVDTRRGHFLSTDRYLDDGFRPGFVEIVGLLDYVQDADIVTLLRSLTPRMADGGAVLFSNVAKNDEQQLLHEVIGWDPMIYRSGDHLVELAEKAGFSPDGIVPIPEQLGQCNLVLART